MICISCDGEFKWHFIKVYNIAYNNYIVILEKTLWVTH